MTKRKTPAKPLDELDPPNDHNGPPTAEEQETALAIYHLHNLRRGEATMLRAKEAYQQASRDLKALFDMAKEDTGYKRQEFQTTLTKLRATHTDLIRAYTRQATLDSVAGLPVARPPQLEFDFDAEPDRAAEDHARRLGYAAGIMGGDPDIPDTIHQALAPHFMEGFNDAQAKLGWALGVVGRIAEEKTAESAKGKLDVQTDIEDPEREPAFGPTQDEQVFA